MQRSIVIGVVFVAFGHFGKTKIFTPCELATEMSKPEYNVSFLQIPTWVCLAKGVSGFDSSYDNGGSHGIFRIAGVHWCKRCGVTCDKFLDDDLEDDIHCAVNVIYKTHDGKNVDGFSGWWLDDYGRKSCATPGKLLQEHECNRNWNLEIPEVARNGSLGPPPSAADFDFPSNSTKSQPDHSDHWWFYHLIVVALEIVLFAFAIIGAYAIRQKRQRQLPCAIRFDQSGLEIDHQ